MILEDYILFILLLVVELLIGFIVLWAMKRIAELEDENLYLMESIYQDAKDISKISSDLNEICEHYEMKFCELEKKYDEARTDE